jgi:hypothetical protein
MRTIKKITEKSNLDWRSPRQVPYNTGIIVAAYRRGSGKNESTCLHLVTVGDNYTHGEHGHLCVPEGFKMVRWAWICWEQD